jgi:hypothetical protein
MMTIPGYSLTAPVCETGDLVLYRATRTLDGLAVLLKAPAAPRPAPVVLRRLEHEYELARDLDSGRLLLAAAGMSMHMKIRTDKPPRILHLEDSPQDAERIRDRLVAAGISLQMDWAVNERESRADLFGASDNHSSAVIRREP